MDWFMGRSRKKDKDASAGQGEPKLYLQEQCLQLQICKLDLLSLVQLPHGLDYYEWLASNTIKFFELTNLMYGTISEFCTQTGCATMVAPNMTQYLWFDERGKKCKCAAPQYIDYVMTFIQKCVIDEMIFPTKYGNVFPSSFESICKKIHRYLLHVVAHMYHSHFNELVLLQLHAHMNWLFLHFTMFGRAFQLQDDKEMEVLRDLAELLHNKYQLLMTAASAAQQAVAAHSEEAAPRAADDGTVVTGQPTSTDPTTSADTGTVITEQPSTGRQQTLTAAELSPTHLPAAATHRSAVESTMTAGVASAVGGPPAVCEVMRSEPTTRESTPLGDNPGKEGDSSGDGGAESVTLSLTVTDASCSGAVAASATDSVMESDHQEVAAAATPCTSHDLSGQTCQESSAAATTEGPAAGIDDDCHIMSVESCKANHVNSSSSSSSEVGPVEQ